MQQHAAITVEDYGKGAQRLGCHLVKPDDLQYQCLGAPVHTNHGSGDGGGGVCGAVKGQMAGSRSHRPAIDGHAVHGIQALLRVLRVVELDEPDATGLAADSS
jgi:hypothetical protein